MFSSSGTKKPEESVFSTSIGLLANNTTDKKPETTPIKNGIFQANAEVKPGPTNPTGLLSSGNNHPLQKQQTANFNATQATVVPAHTLTTQN